MRTNRTNANAAMALVEEDFSEADTVAPLRTGQTLARRLPQAQLRTLPGVGHTPMERASSQMFYPHLLSALNNQPMPAAQPEAPSGALTDLHYRGDTDRLYSGHFREVIIEGCTAVKLQNVSAERIVIRDS